MKGISGCCAGIGCTRSAGVAVPRGVPELRGLRDVGMVGWVGELRGLFQT